MKQAKTVSILLAYILVTAFTALMLYLNKSYTELILIEYIIAATISIVIVGVIVIYYHKFKPRQDKRDLESTLDRLDTPAVLWAADGCFIHFNSAFSSVTGIVEKDDERIDAIVKSIKDSAEKNASSEDGCRIKTADGHEVTVIWHTTSTRISDGTDFNMTIGLDITDTVNIKQELYRYSKKLSAEKNRYAISMELSEIGMMLKDPLNDNYYVSSQLRRMLGFKEEYVKLEEISSKVHPSDRIIIDSLTNAIRSNPTGYSSIHTTEMRVMSADGQYRWYQFRYKVTSTEFMTVPELGGAVMDITREKEKDETIQRLAYSDGVTGIPNRNAFLRVGQETLETGAELNCDYWVIVLDIDEFHIINDTCGYSCGNELLCKFSAVLASFESSEGIFYARIGGDNFALIVRDSAGPLLPVKVIKDVQDALSELGKGAFSNLTLTCSAGYCKMSDGNGDFAQVLDHAEFSLSTRDTTRGSIVRYDNKLHTIILAKKEVEKELNAALDNSQLTLYYQPKINLTNGTVIGVEALVRWIKPDGRIIPPAEFIPIAEDSMLITKISHFVLTEACRQIKEWQDIGLPRFSVSINLSSVDFYQTDVKKSITDALESTGLDAKYLEVELTESLALKDIQNAIRQMAEIKELGVSLSMDDFGTGYSSLSYIQKLPITLLKLDRSFIMYLEDDEVSREIVSAVIKIAKSKKIETIAEGIETQGQADILRKSGCDHAQGYFFGKPMPADKLRDFIIAHEVKNVTL